MTHPLPEAVDTLIFARWILPVVPAGTVLEHHALAMSGGRIQAILPAEQARQLSANKVLELGEHLLMPGLINSHGHAAMTLFRGMANDMPLEQWLNDHIWPAEGQWVNEEFVRDGVNLATAEMIRCGVTCFSDMYFFPNVAAAAATSAGMRAQLAFPIFEFPSAWGQGPDDYIHKGLQLRDDLKNNGLVDIAFGPHAPYTVGDAAMERVATLAAELETSIQIHTHETAGEVADAVAQSGQRPLARLAERGLLGPKTQCVHLTCIDDEDIRLLADFGSHAVHCPESNLKLASGFSPVQRFLDAGINVALGTDGAASNNDLDLMGEMRTAALLAKAVAGNAAALPEHTAIALATLNGARALGMDERIGSLEVGKEADVIAIDLSRLEQQPIFDPVSQLVYTNVSNCVSHSWIRGRQVMDNRQLLTLDSDDIIRRANAWRDRIKGH